VNVKGKWWFKNFEKFLQNFVEMGCFLPKKRKKIAFFLKEKPRLNDASLTDLQRLL